MATKHYNENEFNIFSNFFTIIIPVHLQVVQSRSDFLGVNSWGPHPSLNREKNWF